MMLKPDISNMEEGNKRDSHSLGTSSLYSRNKICPVAGSITLINYWDFLDNVCYLIAMETDADVITDNQSSSGVYVDVI
jgi:hypothetical protein